MLSQPRQLKTVISKPTRIHEAKLQNSDREVDEHVFQAREDEEDKYDEGEEHDPFGSEKPSSSTSRQNMLEKNIATSILESEDDLLPSQFSATPGSPTIVPKRRKKDISSKNTRVEKEIQKVPFLLVEHWIFDTYSLYDSARAVSIGEIGWHEIEKSGHIKLVSYAMDNGFKRNHISTKAVVVGDGNRTARKQHHFEKLETISDWENLQDIVRFFYEQSKKPDITVTVTTVYSRRADGPLINIMGSDIPQGETDKKKEVRIETRQRKLEVARDRSMTLDKILRAHKCGVQGCKSGPYCLAIGNMHCNMSRLDIEFWMSLVETNDVDFNAENPPLEVVEGVIANSVTKANSEGSKKMKKEEAP